MTTYNDMIDTQGRYELRSGTWNRFQEKISDDGHSVILKRPHKTTHYVHDSYEQAVETILHHCSMYDTYVKQDNALGEYLSSDDGAWGRND